jgi:hypothetical protein
MQVVSDDLGKPVKSPKQTISWTASCATFCRQAYADIPLWIIAITSAALPPLSRIVAHERYNSRSIHLRLLQETNGIQLFWHSKSYGARFFIYSTSNSAAHLETY